MKYLIITLALLSSVLNSNAATFISRIHAIDNPVTPHEEVYVYLTTGEVVKIKQSNFELLNWINESLNKKDLLKIKTGPARFIKSAAVYHDRSDKNLKSTNDIVTEHYVPSVLTSEDWARKYFTESKRKDKESQCFNRAHVWSYEWYKKHNFNSSKVFLFFTRKYIREHNFTWWFHVAPYVLVNVNGKVRERVMDMKYMSSPVQMKDWVKRFLKLENPGCLNVSTFSDYANYPENGNCYVMKASMYYYWPLDLENEELHGITKASWVDEEIKTAYLDAFDITK